MLHSYMILLRRAALSALGLTCLAFHLSLPAGWAAANEPGAGAGVLEELRAGFRAPPFAARPWTYWFIMDGNLSREGITADFEAIHRAGLGGVILMEVDVGIPRGPVPFLSEAWRELFAHAVREAERLGLQITLNAGPGWTGSGGPWIPPDRSMQHLVASETTVSGPARFSAVLPQPSPRKPFFGEGALPPALEEARKRFYQDVAVLAFPTPVGGRRLAEIDEKALYTRAPYSSQAGVKPYLPAPAEHPVWAASECVDPEKVLDLTDRLTAEGRLEWDVPAGDWTILRMGRTSTGQNTRPAPQAGVGLESDKFDPAALELHFEAFVGSLLKTLGPRSIEDRGWTMLHIDSWEMSSQNWSPGLRAAFRQRRGYDLWRYLPVFTGRAVESVEVSERFLWDLRQTAQELVIEHHAGHLKTLGRRHGFGLSIEPYDMNPTADLSLGGVADVPMCEFWAKGYGFDTEFTCFEATSIAHTLGRPIVAAEAFTAADGERWRLYPGAMKAQGDWALATGINRIVFHRYQHQPWQDRWPGMTMGPYGVHWERTQTWWELVPAYHEYLARCQFLLRRGLPVADICYLAGEGAPHVFRPPPSALQGAMLDRRGYNFDGCAPEVLVERMAVRDGRLILPHGMSYRVLVLPDLDTMTPGLLRKVKELVAAGATVIGAPPRKSPSLAGYPACDVEVRALADELWGGGEAPPRLTGRSHGLGRVFWGGPVRGASARVQRPTSPLAEARWIWHREGRPATAAPVGRRFFRRDLALEDVAGIEMARLAITADNSFTVWVNGVRVGEGDNFHRTFTFDVGPLLLVGANRFAVAAENGGDAPNPAGWIGALEVRWRDGRTVHLATDASWVSALAVADGWQRQSARTPDWLPVLELGPLEMGPWNKPKAEAQAPELYPDYAVAAEVLAGLGVPPDLEADAPLRYTHRRDGDVDLYFVANPEAVPLVVNATFRVSGKQPELWDAITGTQRALPEYLERHGRVTVPLRFAPHQSWFVVFREPVKGTPQEERNFAERSGVADLTGPWEVHFQPGRGAPDRLAADALFDWAQHPEPGVRHFSGLATYRTEFEWRPEGDGRWAKSEGESAKSRVFLDLGRVEVMAQVRLNEQDLGVVWTAPWAVDVTEALRPGVNRLEVTVANLWPNRLIGDAALPADQRVTWTTWNPFTKDSPLLPSGLLGPVTLQREVPRWKVLVLIYSQTDFAFTNENGAVHLVAQMTPEERERAVRQAQRFFDDDVPALTGGLQRPVTTIRFPLRPLTRLEEGHGYWPGWDIVAPDVEPRFDSIVVLWKGTGTNVLNGQPLTVADAGGLALPRGTEPTYCAVPVEYLSAEHRNVFKHEWGHSLLFYFEAAGTAPKPAVDNHINDTDTRYVHWPTGESYVLEDETDARPIPNSIYHNASGFTRDYYRGETATPDQPRRRLGLTPQAWAAGGPVTKHAAASDAPASVQPVGLRCESRVQPLGIDAAQPRLSWQLEGVARGACQSGYQVLVASSAERLARDEADLWDSGRVASDETTHVRYLGRPLRSSQTVCWKVRVWDEEGRRSQWSGPASWTMGLLRPTDWEAKWIGAALDEALDFAGASWIWHAEPAWTDPASEVRPPRVASGVERWFETRFSWTAGKAVSQARLLATIDNGGEVWMNGQRVADVEAWETASAADVSAWLEPGTNRIVVRAHNGGTTPNPAGVLLKLVLRTKAGDVQTVVSDGSWHSASHTTGEGGHRELTGALPAVVVAPWGGGEWQRGVRLPAAGGLPLFRKDFAVPQPVQRALVHVSGLGHYDLFLDGRKVGDHFLDPAWSAYEKTVYYSTFDLTEALQTAGPHTFGVMLGKGFYNTLGDRRVHGVHADRPLQLILQAHLFYADGSEQVVVSDDSWKTTEGPITHSAILGGEDYDARRWPAGWNVPGFSDAAWSAASEWAGPGGALVAASAPPMKAHEWFAPVRVDEPQPGVFVYDFGQNASAIPRLRVRGRPGQTVRLVTAEQRQGMTPRRNDGRGLVDQAGVGRPHYSQYTLRGGEVETWAPQFYYTGFQYVQVEGAVPADRPNPDGLPVIEELVSVHVRAALPAVGSFACSNPVFNRTDRIIDWAVRGNLAHVLTDCPHREKLGWLEVAYLMGPSIAGRYDLSGFYAKVARDCAEAQREDGLVPTVAPAFPAFAGGFAYTPEWGAAAVVVPWLVFEWYGDREVLEERYAAMKGFVDYVERTATDLVPIPGLGDWYDYGHGKPVGPSQFTPTELSAMATFRRCTAIVAEAARLLGRFQEAQHYRELGTRITDAFNRRWFNGTDEYRNAGSPQCANSMALVTGMVPPGREKAVLERVLEDLRTRRFQQTAGDIGHWYLIQALAQYGRSDVLYAITSRTNLGSYGFIVNNGWTSMPEAWDADTGASMNHCMLGHIQEWFLGWIAGIRPDPAAPGFARFVIAPEPVGDLTWARGSYDSVRGRIESAWERNEARFRLRLKVPPNTRATVLLPTSEVGSARESGRELTEAPGVSRVREKAGRVMLEVAAGEYDFVVGLQH